MSTFALLAPVPLEHLQSGELACRDHGTVSFATRAWEVFDELNKLRGGPTGSPVDVFIYASDDPLNERLEASWLGRYRRYHKAIGGKPPASIVRPQSTALEDAAPFDTKSSPAVFWELDRLSMIQIDKRELIRTFVGYGTNNLFAKTFVPERPMIVTHP